MPIGYIIQCFPVQSQTFVLREVQSLLDAGQDLHVFTFARGNVPIATELAKRVHLIRNIDLLLGLPQSLRRPAGWALARRIVSDASVKSHMTLLVLRANTLGNRLQQLGIDYVHAHWPYATWLAMIVNELYNIPYSISVHAHEVSHNNEHFPHAFKSLKFAAFCNRAAMTHLLSQLHQTASEKSHLVYHGVELDTFSEHPVPRTTSPLEVISVGRLTPTKGFDRLIRACAQLLQQGTDVRLTILGRGSQEAELRELAQTLEFSDHLDMPGWVSHDSVVDYLRKSHVLALMADTNFHDGLPNVVLEAMATGRPVLLSPLPAANEAVSDGVEGFILKSADDISGAAENLIRLAENPEQLATMGQSARKRIQNEHDAEVHLERMLELFDRNM